MSVQYNQESVLGRWCSHRESKQVSFFELQDMFVLEEALSGELAKEVYPFHPYVHRLILNKDMNQRQNGSQKTDEIKKRLTNFYKAGGLLADILDVLDEQNRSYIYEIWNPNSEKWCAV